VSTLNLGILAHVDAGKTSLTERLLHAAGVIDEPGSVDAGSTRTDSLALERQRGITIKSAVVSFAIGDRTVNLIDTPGHPDFIAEVERVLSVLDGAVLVVSAVEGVQPQTRILMRALQRLRIPTLIFVNKIDRAGAGDQRVVRDLAGKLTPAVIATGAVTGLGTRGAAVVAHTGADAGFTARLAELLAEHDDALLAAYVEDAVPYQRLRAALARQTGQALVHPVLFGSAITGAGVDMLMAAIRELLPAAGGTADGPASGTVFKVERGAAGEKIAYVRMFTGTVRVRERVTASGEKAIAIRVFDNGAAVPRAAVTAGQIGTLSGLSGVRIGDPIGEPPAGAVDHHFAPPSLATVVVPSRPGDKAALRVALAQLAEQDPLINVRRDDGQELGVSLYGEVQKEVIQATLASEFGIEVGFRESTTICVERPAGTGEAVEVLYAESNPYLATIGLRIDPAADDSGIEFRLAVLARTVPMFIYKDVARFTQAMEGYVRQSLQLGRYGWRVTDCLVTMTSCNYSSPDGPPATRGPLSTAADFRKLTPLVVAAALRRAGTVVCEPVHRFRAEVPADTLGAVLPALAKLDAAAHATTVRGAWCTLEGEVPAVSTYRLQQRLPALTRGEGVLESTFHHYRPVRGAVPIRST
jgi:ribosomal protection tetracycline resistance protein